MPQLGVIRAILKLKDELTPAMKKAKKSIGKTAKDMSKALLPLSIAFGIIAVASVKAFAEFDAAFTESIAIMGDLGASTKKEFASIREDMETTAREVAKTTTFSATQAAQSYFFLASAGLTAKQSIAALPTVAKFAQAGMFDMARATDLLTDAQSALGLTVDDAQKNLSNMTRVGNVLVKANTLANASVQQFSEALTTKTGAALKILNKDIEEGVAVLAAFADQGIKGAEAGTAFNIVLRDLQTKAIKNSDAFKELGISVFDSAGKMRNIGDIIVNLEQAFAGMSDETLKATLLQLGFSDKSVIFTQTLLGMGEKIKEYEVGLRSAGGAMDEVANKQMKSFKAQMGLIKKAIEGVAITIGGELASVIQQLAKDDLVPLIEKISGAVEAFSKWDDGTKTATIKAAGFAASLPAIILFLGLMIEKIGVLIPLLKRLVWPVGLGILISQSAGYFKDLGDEIRATTPDFVKLGDIIRAVFIKGDVSSRAHDLAKELGVLNQHGVLAKDAMDKLRTHLATLSVEVGATADETILNLTPALLNLTNASKDFKPLEMPEVKGLEVFGKGLDEVTKKIVNVEKVTKKAVASMQPILSELPAFKLNLKPEIATSFLGSKFDPWKAQTPSIKEASNELDNFNELLNQAANFAQIFGDKLGGGLAQAASALGGFSALSGKGMSGFTSMFKVGGKEDGAVTGASFAGGFAKALPMIGALAGPAFQIIQMLFKPKWKKVAAMGARVFGKEFSEKLSKAILESGITENIGDIIAEAGVNKKNLNEVMKHYRALIFEVVLGIVDWKDAQEQLNKGFGPLKDHLVTLGTEGHFQLGRIIHDMRKLGKVGGDVQAFIEEKTKAALDSFSTYFDYILKQESLTVEQAEAVLGVMAVAFRAAIASAGSLLGAVQLLGDNFGELLNKLRGVIGDDNVLLNSISRFYNFVKNNEPQLAATCSTRGWI